MSAKWAIPSGYGTTTWLTDGQWERLRPLLPPPRHGAAAARAVKTEPSSRAFCGDSPPAYRGATCRSASARGRRCTPASAGGSGPGLGPRAGLAPGRRRCGGRLGLDAALPRRHHGAGPPARGGGQKRGGDQALGRSRGGFTTKIHLRAERSGKPICSRPDAGAAARGRSQVVALLAAGAVKRPGRGRPRRRPQRLAGDKAYTGRPVRSTLRRRGIGT